ncbi:MAG: roadblock/LC7 domain-containing protein [Candidatus Hermodarchaeota archaeon]
MVQTKTVAGMKRPEEIIDETLRSLTAMQGIESAIVISEDGFPMFSSYQGPYSEDDELLISAMIAGIVATVSTATTKLGKEQAEHITIETPNGYIVVSSIKEGAILVLTTIKATKLGLTYYVMRQAKNKIQIAL